MTSRNPKYTQEFKQTIVNLYHSGKTYSETVIFQKVCFSIVTAAASLHQVHLESILTN